MKEGKEGRTLMLGNDGREGKGGGEMKGREEKGGEGREGKGGRNRMEGRKAVKEGGTEGKKEVKEGR